MTPEQLADRLNPDYFRKRRRASRKQMGDVLVKAAQDEAPRSQNNTDHEHLADHLRAIVPNGDYPIRVEAEAEFQTLLGYVVKGTPPHVIDHDHSKTQALHWVSGGQNFFAAFVEHPGTQPNDFLSRAAENAAPDVAAIQLEVAEEYLDWVAAG
jgi:hypothetical protein